MQSTIEHEKNTYIFISYSHKDTEQVLPIIERFQMDGFRIWYDNDIIAASEWDFNIASHIQDCSYMIAFISKSYLESENCRDELNYARMLRKRRLLVYLEDVQLPAGMDMRLNRLQAVNWYRYNNSDLAIKKIYDAEGIQECRILTDHTRSKIDESTSMEKNSETRPEAENVSLDHNEGGLKANTNFQISKKNGDQETVSVHKKKKSRLIPVICIVALMVIGVVGFMKFSGKQKTSLENQKTDSTSKKEINETDSKTEQIPDTIEDKKSNASKTSTEKEMLVDPTLNSLEALQNLAAMTSGIYTASADSYQIHEYIQRNYLLFGDHYLTDKELDEFARDNDYTLLETPNGEVEVSSIPVRLLADPRRPDFLLMEFVDRFCYPFYFYAQYEVEQDGEEKKIVVSPIDEVIKEEVIIGSDKVEALPTDLSWNYDVLNGCLIIGNEKRKITLCDYHAATTGEVVLSGQIAEDAEAYHSITGLQLTIPPDSNIPSDYADADVSMSDSGYAIESIVSIHYKKLRSMQIKWNSYMKKYNGRMEHFQESGSVQFDYYSTYPFGFIILDNKEGDCLYQQPFQNQNLEYMQDTQNNDTTANLNTTGNADNNDNNTDNDVTENGTDEKLKVGNIYITTVASGYLALRTEPAMEYSNEIGPLWNGSKVQILEPQSGDYIKVKVIDTAKGQYGMDLNDKTGYVNANFLQE